MNASSLILAVIGTLAGGAAIVAIVNARKEDDKGDAPAPKSEVKPASHVPKLIAPKVTPNAAVRSLSNTPLARQSRSLGIRRLAGRVPYHG